MTVSRPALYLRPRPRLLLSQRPPSRRPVPRIGGGSSVRPRSTRHDAHRPRSRARQAARHAERLYPGALGRLVAHELVTYAECAAGPGGGLVESVITEVLDRTPPRSAGWARSRGLLRSSDLPGA